MFSIYKCKFLNVKFIVSCAQASNCINNFPLPLKENKIEKIIYDIMLKLFVIDLTIYILLLRIVRMYMYVLHAADLYKALNLFVGISPDIFL